MEIFVVHNGCAYIAHSDLIRRPFEPTEVGGTESGIIAEVCGRGWCRYVVRAVVVVTENLHFITMLSSQPIMAQHSLSLTLVGSKEIFVVRNGCAYIAHSDLLRRPLQADLSRRYGERDYR